MHNRPPPSQLGAENRRAERDYFEEVNHWGGFESWELLASQKKLDDYAVQNEKLFHRRFGFSLPREQRQDVIDVKQFHDLTDIEVMSLRKSRMLSVCKGKPTCLYADRPSFVVGVVYVLMCAALLAFFMVSVVNGSIPVSQQMLVLAILLSMATLVFYGGWQMSFQPLKILQQRGIKLGEKWMLREHVPTERPTLAGYAQVAVEDPLLKLVANAKLPR